MRVAGIPLGVGGHVLPPILPTGILLFNGNDGDTITPNLGTIGTVTLWSGTSPGTTLSTVKAYEGVSSCRIRGGTQDFIRYTPTGSLKQNGIANNYIADIDFYISCAFNYDTIPSNCGLMVLSSITGDLLFEVNMSAGVINLKARDDNAVIYNLTVPNFVGIAGEWFKLEVFRESGLLTVKVGDDSISQSVPVFENTNPTSSKLGSVDLGHSFTYWLAHYNSYIDRFIYKPDSHIAY